ncbi:15904_t:CDS:2 [Cetraspora pellucida]|uniref:15904_t:CDS:1 n=1 Tax=Cetraspora pellucida TaxID=1433469 RepID=A0A9N9GKQ6_9GLOM|nr:15904_t:CDS:2 [Cetraspora pellucida]
MDISTLVPATQKDNSIRTSTASSSLDPSASSIVSSHICTWIDWCNIQTIDSTNCSINKIVEFLNYQKELGKAYNTIAGYYSAISKVYHKVEGTKIETHPGNNEDLLLLQLNKKTAFLPTISTGSRPSNLLRLNLLTLSNTFGGSNIKCELPKETKISVAKEKTNMYRMTEDSKKCLFLASNGNHKLVSSDTVAKWIKEILNYSDPNLTAKDTRVLAAFFAQNGGAELLAILALGNWSSYEVYQKFYQHGIWIMLECNNLPTTIIN